jgi:hypothetical protein
VIAGKTRVVMLHVGRCGSTVLAEMLGSHSHVTWDGEIFEPVIRSKLGDPDLVPEDLLAKRMADASWVYGFEIKYLPSHHQRVLSMSLDEILAMTGRAGVDHHITLHRRNYLRRVVSGAIGRERRRWHRKVTEAAPSTAVRLNPGSVPFGPRKPLLEVFDELESGQDDLEAALGDRSAIHLVYEEHVESDPSIAYRLICDYLDLTPEEVRPSLDRTGEAPLSDLITNYDEIVDLLAPTKYAWMLDG